MSEVNPFAAAILPSAQSQRQQSGDRAGQVRRAQDLRKATLQGNDSFEHQVESSDAITPVHDEDARHDQNNKRRGKPHSQQQNAGNSKPEDQASLDLTA
jgi:hypothetical protein